MVFRRISFGHIFAGALLALVLAVSATLFISTTASASVIKRFSFSEVAESAKLIFHGKAVSSRVSSDGAGSVNYTYITFEIIEIIKGDYDGDTIELGFMGGTANGYTDKVSDLKMPTIGETGIYFVESTDRRMANPLYGWDQGHYLVTNDHVQRIDTNPLLRSSAPTLDQFKSSVKDLLE